MHRRSFLAAFCALFSGLFKRKAAAIPRMTASEVQNSFDRILPEAWWMNPCTGEEEEMFEEMLRRTGAYGGDEPHIFRPTEADIQRVMEWQKTRPKHAGSEMLTMTDASGYRHTITIFQ